jgi:hypothetical protein
MKLTENRKFDLASFIIMKAIKINRMAINVDCPPRKFDQDFFEEIITRQDTHDRFPWFHVGEMTPNQTKTLYKYTTEEIRFRQNMRSDVAVSTVAASEDNPDSEPSGPGM